MANATVIPLLPVCVGYDCLSRYFVARDHVRNIEVLGHSKIDALRNLAAEQCQYDTTHNIQPLPCQN